MRVVIPRREPASAWDILLRLLSAGAFVVMGFRVLGWVVPMLVTAVVTAGVGVYGAVLWWRGGRRLRAIRAEYAAQLAEIETAAAGRPPRTSQDPQNG